MAKTFLNITDDQKMKIKKVAKPVIAALVVIGAIVSILLSRLNYSDRETLDEMYRYVSEDDGHLEEYRVHNSWPKWTPFYVEKVGLINHNTGLETKAIYNDWLDFGYDGLAWDYDGHLIDENAEIVLDLSYVLESSYYSGNPRKLAIQCFFELDEYSFDSLLKVSRFCSNEDGLYFGFLWPEYRYIDDFNSEGIARVSVMEKRKYGDTIVRFGFIDREGNFVIPPIINSLTKFDENGYSIVSTGFRSYGMINKKGEFVLQPEYEDIDYGYYSDVYNDGKCYRINYGEKYLDNNLEEISAK